jgi:hypothetical protein
MTKRFQKDKNGFLLGEETLKIVIAVICIIFLVFLLVSLYFSLTGKQDSKYAVASLGLVSNEIKRIDAGGEVNSAGIQIPNPSGWYLFSFVQGAKKPNLCSGENCVCICKNILIDIFDRQIKSCDSDGVCSAFSNLEGFSKIKIENNGVWISVQKLNGFIDIAKK